MKQNTNGGKTVALEKMMMTRVDDDRGDEETKKDTHEQNKLCIRLDWKK